MSALEGHMLRVGGYGVRCSCGTYFDGFDNPRTPPKSVKAYPHLYRDETLGEHLLRVALIQSPQEPRCHCSTCASHDERIAMRGHAQPVAGKAPQETRWPTRDELAEALHEVGIYDNALADALLAALREGGERP